MGSPRAFQSSALVDRCGQAPGVQADLGDVVTWALGHLVALAQPQEVRAEWKRWAAEDLPLVPDHWPLVVLPDTKAQFGVVASVLCAPSIERVVCATVVDAIEERLSFEPAVETRSRKRMQENPLEAAFELRVGALRVYYVVEEDARIVNVLAVGLKDRDRVIIGGEEIEL